MSIDKMKDEISEDKKKLAQAISDVFYEKVPSGWLKSGETYDSVLDALRKYQESLLPFGYRLNMYGDILKRVRINDYPKEY
jgi:hypothetical protein